MKEIFVTQPSLPPLEEFIPYLQKIWDSRILTNNGPFHQQFENALCQYLGVEHLSLFANGMLALITAMQALRITGEVITTPYSFVATTHALHWNNIKPVFIDIDPATGNLDAKKIEAAITPQTTAILPTHVYGNPCATDEIQRIADNYALKVIYDAAHTFGARLHGKSLSGYGDLSILSFHATKVFNTFEGGAIVCASAEMKRRIDYLKNFGFADEVTVVGPGTNAKMNEFQAALGLLQLEQMPSVLAARESVDRRYREAFATVKGIRLIAQPDYVTPNYSYFPILVESEYGISRDELFEKLRRSGIIARRYFYPLISDFPTYRGLPSAGRENLSVASRFAEAVICLPIYPDLAPADQQRVIDIVVARG